MLLKSKDMLKKFSFYINRVCVGKKSLFPEVSFSACIGLYTQEQKWEVLSLEVPTVQHPNYFMSAWTADPGWALLDGQCMTSVCVEVILNSSCQTDFIYFMKVCASCCIWVAVQWSQVENWNSGTQGKNCASD